MVALSTPRRTSLPLVDESCPPTPGRDLDPDEATRITVLLKAISDPIRLRLLTRLATSADEVCVCDFPDLGVSQSTISHHLKKLREAGFVECERRGTWVFYRPVREQLDVLRAFLGGLTEPLR